MASEHAHTLLREFKSMTADRREDVVKRENLKHQLKEKENWTEIQYQEAELEVIRAGAIVESLDGEQLQANSWHL